MSTADGAVSAIASGVTIAATMTRRVPPPCWTEEETLALVNAYKERWFALRRGNLRAADWDAVSAAVSSSGGDTSAKSAIQCRHKIEKLRKRYRAEKQRFLNKPGKFSSSWDLFPVLDAMGFASTPLVVGSADPRADQDDDNDDNSAGFGNYGLKSRKFGSYDGDSDSNLGLGHDFGVTVDDRYREKDYQQGYGGFDSGHGLNHGFRGGSGLKRKYNGELRSNLGLNRSGGGFGVRLEDDMVPVPKGIRLKNYGKFDNHHRHSDAEYGHNSGFPVKTLGDRSMMPHRSNKPKTYGNFSSSLDYDDDIDDMADGFRKKRQTNWDSVPVGLRTNGYGRTDKSFGFSRDAEFGASSGYVKNNATAGKRESNGIEEVVSSVKLLSDMFVKMETSKMELAREIERTRMEMELKHCQMMLETQQQIVQAFADGITEKKKSNKKKAKVSTSPTMNGECDEAESR